jgi:hypothetical protein
VPLLRALWLEGIAAPVLLPEDPDLIESLRLCIHGWRSRLTPFDPRAGGTEPPLCVIEARGKGLYRAHSRYLDAPLDGLPAATAICAVLADLAQAYSDTAAGHGFGLHCGGVLLGGRGVILAGAQRAGKSTLVARLAAEAGVEVLADDVLPVTTEGLALGLGLAPRLRLPLPETASAAFRAHVGRWLGPADDRYGYLLSPTLAPHGRSARAEALVLLDRRETGAARLHALPADEVLGALVQRSIAGPEGPEAVFAAARALAAGLTGLRLVYADLEEAVALLARAFPADGRAVADAVPLAAALPALAEPTEVAPLPVAATTRFRRARGTATRRMGAAAFLWRPGEAMLWHLNPTAQAIWALLDRPASAATLARDLAEVFPDAPKDRLLPDTCALLGALAAAGLVVGQGASRPAPKRPPA